MMDKVQIKSKGMFLRLSTLFWRLMYCVQVLETGEIKLEKKMALFSQRQLGLGAPDCLVVHQTVSGGASDSVRCARLALVKRPPSGNRRRRTAKIHRTVWCAPDCPVSQRSAAQSARDAWPSQLSDGGTGLSGVHRTVSGAPTAPNC